jgi:hypothetical protein
LACEVEYTDEFEAWWCELSIQEQERVAFVVGLLEEQGSNLDHPYSSKVNLSRHSHMRELRVQVSGRPYRILYAFDPRRTAVLLLGGDKTGDGRWYEVNVPFADDVYDRHLKQL